MPKYKRYYTSGSLVFITIVTNQRIPILTHNIELFRQSIKLSKYKFSIIAGVVLPDHVHLIIKPDILQEIPRIITSIKYYFSKRIDFKKENKTTSEIKRKEKGIWQRRYYDHIIRDDEDLKRHLDYIHYPSAEQLIMSKCTFYRAKREKKKKETKDDGGNKTS